MIILFSIWKSSCSCFKNTQVFILHFPVHAELIIYYPPPLRDWGLFNMYWGHVVGTHTFMAHNVSEPRNPSKVQSDKTEVNFKLRTYFLHVERTTMPPSLESIAWNIFSKKEQTSCNDPESFCSYCATEKLTIQYTQYSEPLSKYKS